MRVTPSAAVRALKRAATTPRRVTSQTAKRIIKEFHKLYFYEKEKTWKNNTFWLGVPVAKCPLDLWIYQEIINETKPDVIVEAGTAYGGSALFLASMCDLVNHGQVITIDLEAQPNRPRHARIRYVSGSSVSANVIAEVNNFITPAARVMVILDSDHSAEHVRRELETYSPLVTVGCYLIVEDTNINGHPVLPRFGAGPLEAVQSFLENSTEFERDLAREKLLMTFNPGGYLRRIEAT